MNEQEIDTLEAGRKLDALVAQEIFGWEQRYAVTTEGIHIPVANDPDYLFPPASYSIHDPAEVPHYSTTWEGAGMVVESIGNHYRIDMGTLEPGGRWICEVNDLAGNLDGAVGATFALAICRAALKVKMSRKAVIRHE